VFSLASAAPATVPAGSSTMLTLRYTPDARGPDSGTFSVESETPLDVPLSGLGTAPQIEVLPCPLDFGTAKLGGCHADRSFFVRNTGDSPLHVSSITLSGGGGELSILSGATAPTISPSSQSQLALRFAPLSTGSKSALLSIASDD